MSGMIEMSGGDFLSPTEAAASDGKAGAFALNFGVTAPAFGLTGAVTFLRGVKGTARAPLLGAVPLPTPCFPADSTASSDASVARSSADLAPFPPCALMPRA